MTRPEPVSTQLVEPFLSRMSDQPDYPTGEIAGCQVVTEGISGASIYRVLFAHGPAVLKLTRPTNGELALERARRELSFYRHLADQILLRVPQLLAAYEGLDGIALLFPAYEPSPPPAQWPKRDFLQAARELAHFHAAFWGKDDDLQHLPWLKRPHLSDTENDVKNASRSWQVLRDEPRFANILTEQTTRSLLNLLSTVPKITESLQALPWTLCHGDCITANILRDTDGHFIWADWQEVGLAHGPEDLSFLMQRAASAGADVPREAILLEYCNGLEQAMGRNTPISTVRQAVEAAELYSRLLHWPAYLTQASEEQLRDMIGRIFEVADKLKITRE